MGLLARLAGRSNNDQTRKDEATRLLNNQDKGKHADFNAKMKAEIDAKMAALDAAYDYSNMVVDYGE